MKRLIDKDALVAEIERRIKNFSPRGGQGLVVTKILKDHYEDLLSFIESVEVKEVDLEKELDIYFGVYRDENGLTYDITDNERCFDWKEDGIFVNQAKAAKHFFELGLKAQKG